MNYHHLTIEERCCIREFYKKGLSYTWGSGHTSCTASATCANCGDVKSEAGTVSRNSYYAATCTEAERWDYKATFSSFTSKSCPDWHYGESATGHSYGSTSYTWGSGHTSCTASATCANCGDVKTEVGTVEVNNSYSATCTSAARKDYRATFSTFASKVCPDYHYTGSSLGHNYTSKTTSSTYLKSDATCTSAAVYYYKCSRCTSKGSSTYTYGSALGHNPVCNNDGYAASCTAAGKTDSYSCSRCGVTTTSSSTLAALGHNYTYSYASSSTCMAKCTRCSASSAGAHSQAIVSASAATCTTAAKYNYKCSKCNGTWTSTSGSALGHDYSSKTTTSTYLRASATCTSAASYYYKCSRCTAKGSFTYTYGSSLGHSYSSKSTSSTYLKSSATCTSAAVYYYKCSRCTSKGSSTYIYGSSLGHNWVSDGSIYASGNYIPRYKCSRCGDTTTTRSRAALATYQETMLCADAQYVTSKKRQKIIL